MNYYKFELNMKYANILALLIVIIEMFLAYMIISDNVIIFITPLYLCFVLHELCHGFGFSLFASRRNVKYGAKMEKGILYAICEEPISKIGLIVSLIMPIIILTIILGTIAYILKWYMIFIYALINLAGAAGDLIMILFTIHLPKDVKYIDYGFSMGAYYLSEEDLFKYSNKFMKCTESGSIESKKDFKREKKITISKSSIYWFIGILLFDIIMITLYLL